MKSKAWIGVIVVIVILAAAAAFYFNAQRPPTPPAIDGQQPAVSGKHTLPSEISIGVVLSTTGDVADYGKRSLNGILLAQDDINNSDLLRGSNLKLAIEDAKSTAKDAVAATNKLLTVDNVKFIVGDVLSTSSMAMAPIAEKNKVVMLAPGASNPKFRDAGDYIFRNWVSDDFDGYAMAHFIAEKRGIKSVAVLYQQADYTLGLADAFKREFGKLGGKVVAIESYSTGATDVRTQVTKVLSAVPDAVFLSGEAKENGAVLKQLKEAANTAPVFGNLTVETPECLSTAGSAAEGVIFSTPAFDVESDKPEVKSFVEKYTARFGEKPDSTAAIAYDALMILATAISKSGMDPSKVKDALYATKNFPGISGDTTFDQYGDVVKSIYIMEIKNRQSSFLEEYHF